MILAPNVGTCIPATTLLLDGTLLSSITHWLVAAKRSQQGIFQITPMFAITQYSKSRPGQVVGADVEISPEQSSNSITSHLFLLTLNYLEA